MMSLLSGHRGSVLLQCLQERDWVEHICRQNTSLAYFTAAYTENICLVLMLVHENTHLQISWKPHASVFRADKDTDLIRNSVAWIVLSSLNCWMKHIVFSQPGLLVIIFLCFLCNVQLSCLCLCFKFACWWSQIQTSGFLFIAHFFLNPISTFQCFQCPQRNSRAALCICPTLPLL